MEPPRARVQRVAGGPRRRRTGLPWYASFAVAGLCLTAAPHAVAAGSDDLSAKTRELQHLRAQIEAVSRTIAADQLRKDKLQAALRDAETRIGVLTRAVADTARQATAAQGRLDGLNRDLQHRRDDLAVQQARLARQVRAAYAVGRQGYLKLLLEQQDPAAVSRNLIYYDYFNRARARRIHAVTAQLKRIDGLRTAIAAQVDALERLRRQQTGAQQDLTREVQTRGTVLASVNARIETADQRLTRLRGNEQALQGLIQRLREALADIPDAGDGTLPFGRLKGRLRLPAAGALAARFGAPRVHGKLKWQGVLIDAAAGADVHAVYHGRVAFSGWLRGYGLLLIIDHGNGYMSLYGHNQSLAKGVGDWVDTGEVVASVGDSGGRERPGLYFEIRHNGVPADPLLWCNSRHLAGRASH